MAVKERRDEMRIDRGDPLLAPHRIFEPILIPQPRPHLGGRRIQADVVPGTLQGQQVAARIHGVVENRARVRRIVQPVILIAADDQQRRGERGQTLGSPHVDGAGRRDGDHRAQAGEDRLALESAAAGVGQQQAAGDQLRRRTFGIERRAAGGQHAVAAHRVADQRDASGIDQTLLGQGTLQGAHHVDDVERPSQQGLGILARIGDRRILVANGGHHIALGCQILRQPGHRHRIVAVAVRHHDEWKAGRRPRGIAQRDAGHGEVRRRRRGLGGQFTLVDHRTTRRIRTRGIPQFDAEFPVPQRSRALDRIECQHVDLGGLAQMQRAHADGVAAQRSEFRCVDAKAARRDGRPRPLRGRRRRGRGRRHRRPHDESQRNGAQSRVPDLHAKSINRG